MAARKTPSPGPTPKRGAVAGTVVSVRLTRDELADLDSLWPDSGRRVVRGAVIRLLIARAVDVRCVRPDAEAIAREYAEDGLPVYTGEQFARAE